MKIDPANPPVVKEFRFYPESQMVTVVFGDDESEDFMGPDNYKSAHHLALSHSTETANLTLMNDKGESVVVIVPQETPHETFDL
jgi:hypothetical protein